MDRNHRRQSTDQVAARIKKTLGHRQPISNLHCDIQEAIHPGMYSGRRHTEGMARVRGYAIEEGGYPHQVVTGTGTGGMRADTRERTPQEGEVVIGSLPRGFRGYITGLVAL